MELTQGVVVKICGEHVWCPKENFYALVSLYCCLCPYFDGVPREGAVLCRHPDAQHEE